MNMKKVRCIIGMAAIVSALVLTGCGNTAPAGDTANNTTQAETESAESVQTEQAQEVQDAAAEDMTVETKFGTLHYNDQWREYIKIDQAEEGDVVSVSFTALINKKEYPLFVVNIGGGDGSEVGKLTDGDGKERIVYINASEIKEEEDLEANEQNRLYAMQEDINYVIDHLK